MKKTLLLLSFSIICSVLVGQNNKMTVFDAIYGENYQSMAFDGGWNDSFNNQAVFYGGKYNRTYTSWIDTYGDIVVGYIDNDSKLVSTSIVVDNNKIKLSRTSLTTLFNKDGKMVLFVANDKNPGLVNIFTMNEAENITKWEKQQIRLPYKSAVKSMWAFKLSGEADKIMLFAKLADNSLLMLPSSDQGKSWDKSENISWAKGAESLVIASDNINTVAIALNGDKMVYYNRTLFDADGNKLADKMMADIKLSDLPTAPVSSIKDLAVDAQGKPVLVSVSKDKGVMYSSFGKKGWVTTTLPIKNLAGNIVIDKETPTTVYYTALNDSITEINKCSVLPKKDKWIVSDVTKRTARNNSSVVTVLGASDTQPVQICWIQDTRKDVKINPLTSIKTNVLQPTIDNVFDNEQIKKLMKKVADWQLTASFTDKTKNDWHWGAFYVGLMAAHQATGDSRYWDEMMNVGQYFNWELREDVMHGDRPLVSGMYLYLYENSAKKNSKWLQHTRWTMNLHSSRQAEINPKFKDFDTRSEWWTWCDALFMAPPSFMKYSMTTGDDRALEFAHKHWVATTDYLYSKSDSLFYRDDRYFNKKSTNGSNVFWSRGNGWVMGAIPRILDLLPKDHKYRPYYENLYKQMAAKILNIQSEEGLWTVNLLDPKELFVGESSGSGFFGYSLAWGVNNGLLDKDVYGPAVRKAWTALSGNVSEFGRLGYVQQVAGEPFPFFEHQFHTYASGAFLLFANEMIKFDK